jgi:hypothetical protein
MITAIVRFKLPPTVKREEATQLYRSSMPKYQSLTGLVRKYYLFDEQGVGGGVYLWESRAAAERVYTKEWRSMIASRYGAEPEIAYYETPVIVDNSGNANADAAE